jgi:hypothetical protein
MRVATTGRGVAHPLPLAATVAPATSIEEREERVMKLLWWTVAAAMAGLVVVLPVGGPAIGAAVPAHAAKPVTVDIEHTKNPTFVPDKVTIVGQTPCQGDQVTITNDTKIGVSLTPGDGYVIEPHHSVGVCANIGAGGEKYDIVDGISGYASTLTIKVKP